MSRSVPIKFRLYIAGSAPNSAQATANLRALCRTHLPDRHEIEIVDVLRTPKLALAHGIFMTPTLVRISPAPILQIVGTLSQPEPILHALGLESAAV
jgi:circadian clock protein KaiB